MLNSATDSDRKLNLVYLNAPQLHKVKTFDVICVKSTPIFLIFIIYLDGNMFLFCHFLSPRLWLLFWCVSRHSPYPVSPTFVITSQWTVVPSLLLLTPIISTSPCASVLAVCCDSSVWKITFFFRQGITLTLAAAITSLIALPVTSFGVLQICVQSVAPSSCPLPGPTQPV